MTAFSTPCCKSVGKRPCALRRWLAVVLVLLACTAMAGEIRVRNAALGPGEEAYVIDADFDIDIGPRLEEAVSHGVPLHFVLEFDLTRPRWYWVDEHIEGKIQRYRVSYHALTRQYRLSVGSLHQSFDTLSETLGVLERVRNWAVVDKSELKAGEIYNAALRLKLDFAQLPKPFQVSAIGDKDWNMSAEIRRWSFIPGMAERSSLTGREAP